jgi:hypothetical protein
LSVDLEGHSGVCASGICQPCGDWSGVRRWKTNSQSAETGGRPCQKMLEQSRLALLRMCGSTSCRLYVMTPENALGPCAPPLICPLHACRACVYMCVRERERERERGYVCQCYWAACPCAETTWAVVTATNACMLPYGA